MTADQARWMLWSLSHCRRLVSLIWCPTEDERKNRQTMRIFLLKPNWDFMLKLMKWKQNFRAERQNQCRRNGKLEQRSSPSRHRLGRTVKPVFRLSTFKHMPWNVHKSSIMNILQNLIWHESASDFGRASIKYFEDTVGRTDLALETLWASLDKQIINLD